MLVLATISPACRHWLLSWEDSRLWSLLSTFQLNIIDFYHPRYSNVLTQTERENIKYLLSKLFTAEQSWFPDIPSLLVGGLNQRKHRSEALPHQVLSQMEVTSTTTITIYINTETHRAASIYFSSGKEIRNKRTETGLLLWGGQTVFVRLCKNYIYISLIHWNSILFDNS